MFEDIDKKLLKSRKERIEKTLNVMKVIAYLDPVFLDTETTGFGESDEVINLAISDFNGELVFNELFYTDQPISPKAFEVHKINKKLIEKRGSFVDHITSIKNLLKNRYVVGYNIEFDFRMIVQTARKFGNKDLDHLLSSRKKIDLMRILAVFYGEWNKRHGNYRWVKMKEILKYLHFQADLVEAHTAMGDVESMIKIVKYFTINENLIRIKYMK